MLNAGDKAYDFTLPGIDESGAEREYSLKDFKGKTLILYFYPKDNTHGCTMEACDFRDNMARLLKDGVAVAGVSPDSIRSHKNFREKHGLEFPLLSDPDKKIAQAYGAFGEKKIYGKTSTGILRSTFIIDGKGYLKKIWRNVKATGHVDEVLKGLKE